MVPPYCGVPRVSHQFPVALVVTTEVAVVGVVDDTVEVVTDVEVVVTTAVVVVVVVAFVVVDAEPQDESSTAATNTRDKLNQISLCFTLYLHFLIMM
jgi:UDP-N-acetylmuramyl pentapeptide phosphotransferase/UDP-N-acetylglucosamine-1-phosphate transferase